MPRQNLSPLVPHQEGAFHIPGSMKDLEIQDPQQQRPLLLLYFSPFFSPLP